MILFFTSNKHWLFIAKNWAIKIQFLYLNKFLHKFRHQVNYPYKNGTSNHIQDAKHRNGNQHSPLSQNKVNIIKSWSSNASKVFMQTECATMLKNYSENGHVNILRP